MEKKKISVNDYLQLFLNKDFVIVILVAMAAGFAKRMCSAPLTSHGMSIVGMTGTIMGLSITVNKIAAMIARPVSGATFDFAGCKKTLIIAFLAQGLSFIFYSFTNSIPLWYVGKALEGFAASIQGGLIPAAAVSIAGANGRGLAITACSAFSGLVSGYATVVSKSIFTTSSYARALLIGGLVYLVPAVLCLFINDKNVELKKRGSQKSLEKAEEEKKNLTLFQKLTRGILLAALPVCTMGLFGNAAQELNKTYIVQLGEVTGIDVTGGIALAGVVSFFVALVIGVAIDKAGTDTILYIGYGLLALSNFLYGFGSTQAMYTLAAIAFTIGTSAYWPALQAMVYRVAGPGRQGAASATLYLFLDVVAIIMGAIIGVLYDAVGLQNVFKVFGFILIIAIVYYTVLKVLWLNKYLAKQDELNASKEA